MSAEEILNNFSTQTNQTNNSPSFSSPSNQTFEEIMLANNSSTEEDETNNENNNEVNLTEEELTESDFKAINLLIKEGKLMPMEDDNGNLVPLSTKGDLLELIDRNNEFFQENSYKTAQQEFYQNKSPIWHSLLEYAENSRDLKDIEPLFNAIRTSESTNSIDLEKIEGQEEIIRMYGSFQGLDSKTIDEDIEDLKERGKLKDRATHLKPSIDKFNEQRINSILAEKQQEEEQRLNILNTHYNNVIENIIKPVEVGGLKLTNEHKQLVASTLVPDAKLGGLPIYSIIDNLIATGKFDILSKIALLAVDGNNFDKYYSSKVSNNVAADLQRKLRTANTNQNNTGSITNEELIKQKQNKQSSQGSNFYFAH